MSNNIEQVIQSASMDCFNSVAKGGPGWACPHLTHINCFFKSLVCPVTGKNINCSNKTVKYSIKTVSSSILPTKLPYSAKL